MSKTTLPARIERNGPAPEPAEPRPATHFRVGDIEVMARHVAQSRLFGMDEAQAFTLMLVAQAKGLHPIQAVERYHVIQGRPAMKADAMLADFLARGGTVKWGRHDHELCEAVFTAPGVEAPTDVAWSLADAKRAGLATKDMYAKFPRQMLRARVISEGIRMTMPGILSGIYTPEEVADFGEAPPAPEHHAVNLDNQTGHGRTGAYADPKTVAQYRGWLKSYTDSVNSKWLDHWTSPDGNPHPQLKDLVSAWQLSGHLLKFCKGLPADAPCHLEAPADPKSRQYDPLVAVAWGRASAVVETEARRYCRELWRTEAAKLAPPEPETQEPAAAAEDETQDVDPDDELPERFGDREPGEEG